MLKILCGPVVLEDPETLNPKLQDPRPEITVCVASVFHNFFDGHSHIPGKAEALHVYYTQVYKMNRCMCSNTFMISHELSACLNLL